MKGKTAKALRLAFYTAGACVLMTEQTAAYVDPATTSYVVQIVAGIVIACGTGIGIFWNRMRRKMRSKKQEESAETAVRTESENRGGVMTAEDLLADSDAGSSENEN